MTSQVAPLVKLLTPPMVAQPSSVCPAIPSPQAMAPTSVTLPLCMMHSTLSGSSPGLPQVVVARASAHGPPPMELPGQPVVVLQTQPQVTATATQRGKTTTLHLHSMGDRIFHTTTSASVA